MPRTPRSLGDNLQIRVRPPLARWVRAAATAADETATELVERAIRAELARAKPQGTVWRSIRAVGYREARADVGGGS
jgi:hypothetical protein